jgi:hypothetical protein
VKGANQANKWVSNPKCPEKQHNFLNTKILPTSDFKIQKIKIEVVMERFQLLDVKKIAILNFFTIQKLDVQRFVFYLWVK